MERSQEHLEKSEWWWAPGGTLGIEEYLTQSNGNTNFLNQDELINLISIRIASYNFKEHLAADIRIDSNYLPPENNKSQLILILKVSLISFITLIKQKIWNRQYWDDRIMQSFITI